MFTVVSLCCLNQGDFSSTLLCVSSFLFQLVSLKRAKWLEQSQAYLTHANHVPLGEHLLTDSTTNPRLHCFWINLDSLPQPRTRLLWWFFLRFFFLCGPFLKSLLNLLQYCFCFLFQFFGPEACGIFAPRPGIEHVPRALEGEVLTTGPPGKSPDYCA